MPFSNVLILGSGIAGLTAALQAGRHVPVAVLTKGRLPDGSTNYAQGGIASVTHPDDTFAQHMEDTLEAGDGLCDPEMVHILASNGPKTIEKLIEWGVRFTKDPLGKITPYHLALEGGHSYKRILHAADLTGKEIMRALLLEAQLNPNITFWEHRFALDLIKDSQGNCIGAHVLNRISGKSELFYSNATILSTGGSGQVFRHTTNPAVSTGDGIAIAHRAGAPVADLEFMQFHPTALYEPQAERPFLISEAVRGWGGILKNHDGQEFMDGVHPLRSLAPRDVVARAIDAEMKRTKTPHVFLDITHRKRKDLKVRFPNIFTKCESIGFDISKDQIPVVPAAHYMCGGVLVDSWSRTSIPGLYACGEVACTGVHGANRLASNSLLESVVFSLRAWTHIQEHALATSIQGEHSPLAQKHIDAQSTRGYALHQKVQNVMWDKVGIVRTNAGLQEAMKELETIEHLLRNDMANDNTTMVQWETRNMLLVAKLIVTAALKRKESRGLHTTIDYPDKDASFCKHLQIQSGEVDFF